MIQNRLSIILEEKNIKQTELSAMTGISKNTISSIVNNSTDMMRYSTLDSICHYLQIKPYEFFEYDEHQMVYDSKIIEKTEVSVKIHTTLYLETLLEGGIDVIFITNYSLKNITTINEKVIQGKIELDESQSDLISKCHYLESFSTLQFEFIINSIINDVSKIAYTYFNSLRGDIGRIATANKVSTFIYTLDI